MLSSLANAAKSIGSGVVKAGSTALSSLGNAGSAIYKGADSVLGGLLPGAVAPSAGWLGQGGLGLLGTPGVTGHQFPGIGTGSGAPAGGFMGGLGNLYGGVDKVLGGMLPNIGGYGVTPSQGWLGSMYGKADNALGGYLPGGQTPGQHTAATTNIFGQPSGQGLDPNNPFDLAQGQGQLSSQSGGGFLDRLGKYAEAGSNAMDIYNLTQAPTANDNTTGYNQSVNNAQTRVIQPGVGSVVHGGARGAQGAAGMQYVDPAMQGAHGIVVPSTPGTDTAMEDLQARIDQLETQLQAAGAGSAGGKNKTKKTSVDTLKGKVNP